MVARSSNFSSFCLCAFFTSCGSGSINHLHFGSEWGYVDPESILSPSISDNCNDTSHLRMRTTSLSVVLFLASAAAFTLPAAPACKGVRLPRPAVVALAPQQPPEADEAPLEVALPLPRFSWVRVLFFAANPAALLPLPVIALLLRLNLFGPAFCLGGPTATAAAAQGALFACPMLLLSLLPLERLPGLGALAEVTAASQTISLYAMGALFAPLRMLGASAVISASAAVFEELAFRGVLQTTLVIALGRVLPVGVATTLAVALQGLLFGVVHSYTASAAYLITATVAGVALGAAFASSGSLMGEAPTPRRRGAAATPRVTPLPRLTRWRCPLSSPDPAAPTAAAAVHPTCPRLRALTVRPRPGSQCRS